VVGRHRKSCGQKGQDRLKGDERILGDSDFVTSILAEAKEELHFGQSVIGAPSNLEQF
jgi:hypothetical protein